MGIGLDTRAMSLRHHARTVVALAAAYAVVLQTLLLAIGSPVAGAREFNAEFAAFPLCSGPSHSAPAHHSGDCPVPCPGCCCGPAAGPAPAPAVTYAPAALQIVAPAPAVPALVFVRISGANRSRAPPSA
jgi:hypothetical protein